MQPVFLSGRGVPPRILTVIFVLWLGTSGVLLWQMASENRLRGFICAASR